VMTNRAFDMPEHPATRPCRRSPETRVAYVLRHLSPMC
jgi:hypothetical protein